MNTCTKCHAPKDPTCFPRHRVNGVSVPRLNVPCKDCTNALRRSDPKIKAAQAEAMKRYRAKSNLNHCTRLRNQGLTEAQYEDLLFMEQKGLCAICSKWAKLVVDHDHTCCNKPPTCGKCVRGLLCYPCNIGLGQFKDNPDLLRAAIAYLAKGKIIWPIQQKFQDLDTPPTTE